MRMANETNNQNTSIVPQPIALPVVPPPVQVQPFPQTEPVAEKPQEDYEDLSDLTDLSNEDRKWMFETESVASGVEEAVNNNVDDLVNVSREDIMGKPPKSKVKPVMKYKRTQRVYQQQPTGMSGVQM